MKEKFEVCKSDVFSREGRRMFPIAEKL